MTRRLTLAELAQVVTRIHEIPWFENKMANFEIS